jgi:hypothetical protein
MSVSYGVYIVTPDPEFVLPALAIPTDATQTYALITLYFGITNTYTEKLRVVLEWSYKGVSTTVLDVTIDAGATSYYTVSVRVPLSDVQTGFVAGECEIKGTFIVTVYKYNPASGAYDVRFSVGYKDVTIRLIDPTDPSWTVVQQARDACPFTSTKCVTSTSLGEALACNYVALFDTVSSPVFSPPSACRLTSIGSTSSGAPNCMYGSVDLRGKSRCYLLLYVRKDTGGFTVFVEGKPIGFARGFILGLPVGVWAGVGIRLPPELLTIDACFHGYSAYPYGYIDEWWIVCK